MKKCVLMLVVTVSLAVMAAQAGYSPCSLTHVPAGITGISSAHDEETASHKVLKMQLNLLSWAAAGPISIFTEIARPRGRVLAEESSQKAGQVEGAKANNVLNEDDDGEGEDDEHGEEDEEEDEEEEGEGWDRVWDAPKLA